ncbi:TPA: hypothetical protein HL448_19985 [Escherichia coli]|nr:hypothetical protein [Shigella flexneri]EFI8984601.1 hypothetical protein [Escherichia coli]EAB1026198.1 hypothetical protein [Shigella flexneri]EFP9260076.1 hypothetical protein [Shigella flexneri]EFP9582645.1 hypothetical protein [Shigella flexneri]
MLFCTDRGDRAIYGTNQHNHGFLVSCEGMACAPWYVRQRLRRALGRYGSAALDAHFVTLKRHFS